MEGVALALREGMGVLAGLTSRPDALVASGGGAKSRLWRQIQADVFGLPLTTVVGEERAVVGAAMLAGIGTGVFGSFGEAREACVSYGSRTEPRAAVRDQYDRLYGIYRSLYPALQPVYGALADWRATAQSHLEA
jgi:xylulokinase